MKHVILMVKGTNASGKSSLVFMLRTRGWDEKVFQKKLEGERVVYTKFTNGKKSVAVVGKYGAKGGGCDSLKKNECLRTIQYLWDKPYPVMFEGQNIADTLTTHPIFMMQCQGEKHNMTGRGIVPSITIKPKKKRLINVLFLTPTLEEVFKRLKKRTPDKVLKNNGAKTRQKHTSVLRQYSTMKSFPDVKAGKIVLQKFDNMGTKKEFYKYLRGILSW